jgi:hypothetical protein
VAVKAAIEQAVAEILASFPDHGVDVTEDGQGGARVRVHGLHIGDQYEPSICSIEFVVTFQYPAADVYPHFLIARIKRKNGQPLGDGFSPVDWEKTPVTQVSRRSNRMNANVDTAAIKLTKVLQWIRGR